MELIPPGTKIDFIGKQKIAIAISIVIILAGIASIVLKGGVRYGIDFSGGTMVQVAFKTSVSADQIRSALTGAVEGTPVIQETLGKSNEFIIQLERMPSELGGVENLVSETLGKAFGADNVSVSQAQMVGPRAGAELRQKALLAIIISWAAILLYVWWRFEIHWGIGAIVALVHDVLITVSVFSFLNKQFDLQIIAALLTIIGYSINDTIVIFDRVRENIKKYGSKYTITEHFNMSINETLGRTILTAATVFFSVLALFFFGGPVIHDFSLALLVGSIAGTYSTVYIASPVVLYVQKRWRGAEVSKF
ncbi:protein translocase subunit SecF [bacterium]|nr:MAG: protein translocase subunit SecF [bacterium]